MSPKWLIFLMTLWGVGSMLGLVLEGAYPGGSEQTVFNTLLNCKILTSTSLLGKFSGLFTDFAMWGALAQVFIWDFSFWKGPYEIIRWLIFLPITIGILFTIITAWIRGVGGS